MNRLADQSSPYLAQHKDNPVDWWPWCEEALGFAQSSQRPIFLSVGYSSCHWCHVMAHESFENPETAQFLNDNFVAIKVDREERPDVDAIYMEAVQAMTGSGGWPMTVFLLPDGSPFYGGTYFPPTARAGLPGFMDLLIAISDAWRERRPQIILQSQQLKAALEERTHFGSQSTTFDLNSGTDQLARAAEVLLANHDPHWGGFGGAPKFPQANLIELLFHHYLVEKSASSLAAASLTLDSMISGGMYDHIGGGFARYSVDSQWTIPHFEKMLYDQAQLTRIYTIGWSITGNENWRQVVAETVEYVLRDLSAPGEALFSSQDADSQGEEGRYYTFEKPEIEEMLGQQAQIFMEHYGMGPHGNFQGRHLPVLMRRGDLQRDPRLEFMRQKVLSQRQKRIPPALDDKVILEWNAMFISALAQAGFTFGRDDWIDESRRLMQLIESRHHLEGRWMRIWRRGSLAQKAFAADYAQLIDAYTRLYESCGDRQYLIKAEQCAKDLRRLFEDTGEGGFYTTASDQEHLFHRTKDLLDGAIPSANSVAARSLARLAKFTDDHALRSCSKKILDLAGNALSNHPNAFPLLVQTARLLGNQSWEIVIPGFEETLIGAIRGRWIPDAIFAFGEPLPSPLWHGRVKPMAYLCRGFSCLQPISDPSELAQALDSLI